MSGYDNNKGSFSADHYADPMLGEPSMSAPSPMPGKPAASYVKPAAPEKPAQTDWQPAQETSASYGAAWNGQYPPQQGNVPLQQGYYAPAQQYGWQQGQAAQQGWNQPYQQPAGQSWNQPYPAEQDQQAGNSWQGGYAAGQWVGGYTPAYDQQPANTGNGGSGGGKPVISRMTMIILLAALALILIVVVVVNSHTTRENENQAIYESVKAYEDRFCEGVYVDGIHLGGMTYEEAKSTVQQSAQLKCDEWNVALRTPAGEYLGEINSYHLGMTVHVDDALNEAWQQGHSTDDVALRKAEMDALKTKPFHTSTALPSSDTADIDRILNEIAEGMYVPATNAYATFNPQLTNPFEVFDGVPGQYLDVASIKTQVYDMVARMESGEIKIAPTVLQPAVTREMVESQTRLIGTHYTPISTTSTENRNLNVERACDLINGVCIEPGKTFSFNEIVGPRSKKNGFYTAIEYAYGKQVEGYGGGVCQVSSTIYVAAVRANMEIVKRTQHSLEVNYTTFGLDATVNYDGKKIDFVFRNNTNSNIYVVTKVMKKPKIDKNHYLVVCEIYGPAMEPGVTYDLVSTQVEVPIPEPTIVPDKKAEHVIYMYETLDVPGKIGYEVDSFKVKYVDGTEVERTHLFHDTYAAVQPITYVGVSERPLDTWTYE